MKVIIEYDKDSGAILDKNGMQVANWMSLDHFGEPETGSNVRDLIKLKDAGFTAEDIVTMKEGGVL